MGFGKYPDLARQGSMSYGMNHGPKNFAPDVDSALQDEHRMRITLGIIFWRITSFPRASNKQDAKIVACLRWIGHPIGKPLQG